MIKLVVDNPAKYVTFQIESYKNFPAVKLKPVEKGYVHAMIGVFTCPDGLPNCRECGGECKDETHCKKCGVLHGVAPDSKLKANGLIAVEE